MNLLPFIKPFKVILTKRFDFIKLNRNFNDKYDKYKYKLFRLLIWGRIVCTFFVVVLLFCYYFILSSSNSKNDFSEKL